MLLMVDLRCLALLGGLVLSTTGCLPDPLSDAEIEEKLAGQGICVPKHTGAFEACDDGNDLDCDGCFNNKKRGVFDVRNKNDIYSMATSQNSRLQQDKSEAFSVDLWFKADQSDLKDGDMQVIFSRMKLQVVDGNIKPGNRRFIIALARVSPTTLKPVCSINLTDDDPDKKQSVVFAGSAVNSKQWHHVTCAYEDGKLYLAVDNNTFAESSEAIAIAGAGNSMWESDDNVLFGYGWHAPSKEVGLPSIRGFMGQLDEIRWRLSFSKTQDNKPLYARRYRHDRCETALLLHLDGPGDKPTEVQCAATGASAALITSLHSPQFAADSCFDNRALKLLCAGKKRPPWCEPVCQKSPTQCPK
jgi:hypothetical protein